MFLSNKKSDSISKKATQGTFWLFCFRIVDQFFGFLGVIILARLLAPKDFGIFGITVLAVSVLETFSQNGFTQALVQKKDDIRPYLDSAFVVQVARGLLLALILFFLAPFISVFFKAPETESILKVVSMVFALQAFYNIAIVYFSKELEFHKYFFYQVTGTLVEFVVSVAIALAFHSVWALVFGLLAGTVTRLIISYIAYTYRPHFIFNTLRVKELFGFGKWIFIANVVAFFTMQADSFFVAKILGVIALGFYQIAYKIPSILAIDILAGAIFPTYAKIQDNVSLIKEAYMKILRLFSFLLMPMAGGILVLAPEFTKLFLGVKWLPAVAPMQILVVSTLIWTIAVLSNYVFLALGKPELEAQGVLIRFLLLALLLYPFIVWWEVLGAATAVLISALCSALWFIFMVIKTIDCKLEDFLKNLSIPLVNTLGMVLVIFIFKNMIPVTMVSFLSLVAVGMFIYFGLTYLADTFLKNKMIPLLKESVNLLIK